MPIQGQDFDAGVPGDALSRTMRALPDDEGLTLDELSDATGLETKSLNDSLISLHRLPAIKIKLIGPSEYYLSVIAPTLQQWCTIDEADEFLRVSKRTIYQLLREGQFVCYCVG